MSKPTLAGAAALLCAPVVIVAATLAIPTLSDDAPAQVAALTDHRGAMLAGLTLQTVALVLLIAGTIWLALALAPHAPRLALGGGVLGLAGSLVILFEAGVRAAAPAIVAGLDPAHATAALDRIQSSAAVAGLEPLSLLGGVGLTLLGVAAVRAGAPRWAVAAIAVGSIGETAGFATGTKALVIAGFTVLLAGLAPVAARATGSAPLRDDARLDVQTVR